MENIFSPRTFFVDVLCLQGEHHERTLGIVFWTVAASNILFTYLMTH